MLALEDGYIAKHLRVRLDERGVAHVALNRPPVNAFDPELIEELTQTFTQLGKDPQVKVAVLAGEGKVFSAGADLSWMRDMAIFSHEENVADAYKLATMLETLYQFPKPLIGSVHGAAIGGGAGLAAVCDYVIAAEGTRFAFTEARLGLRPSTISPYCIEKLGKNNASVLFKTAQDFVAEQAREWGLVDRVVPLDQLSQVVEMVVEDALKLGKGKIKEKSMDSRGCAPAEVKGILPANPQMDALVETVTGLMAYPTPEARAALMRHTAKDIAEARSDPDTNNKITAFLSGLDREKQNQKT